jgi:RimJ/RimL family protein N-acetyltransferase
MAMQVLETERLVLRHVTLDDAAFMLGLVNDPTWLRFIGDRGVRSVDDAREYLRKGILASYAQHGFGLYMTELKDGAQPIGICGLVKRDTLPDVDVGFALLPQFAGQGYAHEAASAVMAHARQRFGLGRVVAITNPDNHGSIRVLEKIGLKFERLIRVSADAEELALYAWNA